MFTYIYDDATVSIQLQRLPDGTYRATVDGRTYHFAADAIDKGSVLAFPESGARTTTYASLDADSLFVHVDGETFALTRASKRRQRRSSSGGAHGGELKAQMPGQVREVLVSAGDTVTRGQALVILEAMKMEVRATAPADGTIKQVLVTIGEVVRRGQVLAIIEQPT